MHKTLRLFSVVALLILSTLLASCSSQLNLSGVGTPNLPARANHIALLLPVSGRYAAQGSAIRDGFFAGYYAKLQQNNTPVTVKIYDTGRNNDINAVYAKALSEGADIVVGPLQKANVTQLANTGKISVPTIALNYTDAKYQPPNLFFEFGISPLNEAVQVAEKASQQGLSKALIIAPAPSWGQHIASAFGDRFQQSGGTIVDTLYYQPGQNLGKAIRQLLQASDNKSAFGQRRQDFDMIFVVAQTNIAREILPLLRFYYAGNVPTYSISMINPGMASASAAEDLDNVKFTEIPGIFANNNSTPIESNIQKLWPKHYRSSVRLYALGLDAFMLTQNLRSLPTNPNAGIQGQTGQLFLGNNHWIVQKFIWAQFKNGTLIQL